MTRPWTIWIGFDPREAAAFAVCRESVRKHLKIPIPVRGVVLSQLQHVGLYKRPTERRLGRIYDKLSERADYDGACSSEFALSRFFVGLVNGAGLALFMDSDMLARTDLGDAFRACDRNPGKAVYCVKHEHEPDATVKMDGQLQTRYARKNWSSFMVFDCNHPANKALTLDLLNTAPGRDLHAFCWLDDQDIGDLGQEWNWLAGHSSPGVEPKVIHWTSGHPYLEAFKNAPFADEYHKGLAEWAA